MYVAVGQFAVTPDWNENADKCVSLMHAAKQKGASLLVLPEALLARDDGDPDLSVKSAQTLEGVSETTAGRKRWQHAHHHIDGPYSVLAGARGEHAGGDT